MLVRFQRPLRQFLTFPGICLQLPVLKPTKPKRRILILSPEETKDKALEKYVDTMSKALQRKSVPGRVLRIIEGNVLDPPWLDMVGDFEQNIEHFRPMETMLNSFRAHALIDTLALSFKKTQLKTYVREHGQKCTKRTKHQLAETILREVWNLKIELKSKRYRKELLKREAQVLQEETIDISNFEFFLLLLLRAKLWKNVKALVSKVKLSKDNTQLLVTGTRSQIDSARLLMLLYVEACYREEVDLLGVRELYERKFGTFSVRAVGKFTDVYFFHLHDDIYELVAVKRAQVGRIRRLFLWHLDYNLHQRDTVELPANLTNTRLIPYIQDYSLLWRDRGKRFYTLESEEVRKPSRSLQSELMRFSDDSLRSMESRALQTGYDYSQLNDPEISKETVNLLESIGLMPEETEKTEATASETEPLETNESTERAVVELLQERRDAIYAQLTDFQYRQNLAGVSDEDLEPPVFTVTLGSVLFEKAPVEGSTGVESYAPTDVDMTKCKFNSNVTLAFDKALACTTLAQPMGLLDEDPNVYSLQLKFVPSPYKDDIDDTQMQRALDDQIKYPPVEMWVQLNTQAVPDLDTLQAVTVEGENNVYVCCPGAPADMRVSSQITGRLLRDVDNDDDVFDLDEIHDQNRDYGNPDLQEERREARAAQRKQQKQKELAKKKGHTIEEVMAAPTARFNRFASQHGMVRFLKESQFDIGGRKGTNIAPWMMLDINGQKVRYDYVNTTYRRELTLETPEGITVQLLVVDGGLLGGRYSEIRFVGDATGLGRKDFDKLLDYTVDFVNKL